jgi:alpha-tubulin suppressor-like RCC1 family protein
MISSTPHFLLSTLLGQWHEQLTDWAYSGRLTSAAQQSLLLSDEPQALKELVSQLASGDYKEIPEILLLPATALNGAMAAYAAETGSIFLNADWLQNAPKEQVLLVLTEELGHHLDAMLNQTDTPGDEGELLTRLLTGEKLSLDQIALIESDNDQDQLFIGGQTFRVEQAVLAKVSVTVLTNGNESDGSPVAFNFQRSGVTSSPLSVNYRLFGTATAGSDYSGATTGTVNFAAGSSSATLSLPALADVVIDPGETIIAQISPSGTYAITPGQQTATATISAEGIVVSIKAGQFIGSSGEYSNSYAFAALKSDGTVIAWGDSFYGGIAPIGLSGVSQIYSGDGTFAALKTDGSVVAWGDYRYGGIAPTGLSDVNEIYSNAYAFAALNNDGSVVAWGDSSYGGTAPLGLSAVKQIFSTSLAFAALRSDGSVIAWGDSFYGGIAPIGLSGVTQVYSNTYAFAALKSDGSVVAWGDSYYGGTAPAGLTGVTQIFSNGNDAFAALKSDGSVVAWGNSSYGGSAPTGLSGINQIFSTVFAFAGLKNDGSVVAWGETLFGGTAPPELTGVTQIFSTSSAFAALKNDGSVIAWGDREFGGLSPAGLSGVTQVYSNTYAFAALKNDGSVVAWGDGSYGGNAPVGLTGVTQIFSNGDDAFAALKSDGSVVAWGNSSYGGTAPAGLNGVVGFANPLTDDHLLLKPITNWISVVSLANGNEADGSPVVFRFSRTGNTSDPLTVSYRLFGTAQAGLDYTGTNTGSITFQAGSSTAQLALSALADGALIDPGETIIARIDASTLYGITPGQQMATATITAEGVAVSVKEGSSGSGDRLNVRAFAAIKRDGSVVAWGDSRYGGMAPSGLTGVAQVYSNGTIFAALRFDGTVVDWGNKSEFYDVSLPTGLAGVTQIFSTSYAFAALKSNGSVITWGASYWGGRAPSDLTDVKSIYSTSYAFAALKNDGSVVSWGSFADTPSGLNDVIAISATNHAFAALHSDGTVVAWGWLNDSTVPTGLSGVTKIYSSGDAFAALKNDGTVVAWGKYGNGGTAPYGLSGITEIYSNPYAFAALTADGSVVAWGEGIYGGSAPTGLTGVAQIFSTTRAFAALKTDGSVVAWGDQYSGGLVPPGLNNVAQIFSNGYSFAALKKDGTVVAWGDNFYGGLAPSGLRGVTQIFSSGSCFAALKSDGSVEAWGGNGDDGGNEPTGLNGVVAFANPFTDDRLILDNTLPIITLAMAPTAGVTEDGTENLIYTFSRTGPTTSALTVNYTVSGTATNGIDYTGIAVTPAIKTVSFAAGSTTATVTIDPTTDTTIEADETVALTLAAGSVYSIDSTSAVVARILNDDFAIENHGNSALLRGRDGQTYVSVGNTTTPITYLGTPTSPGNASSTWQMLAAETIGGSNKLLWRYNPTGQVHVWTLDSNWGWTGADTGLVDANSSAGWGLESSFHLDLNGDTLIGAPLIPIESQGNTSLGRHFSTAQPYVSVGNYTTPITYLGSPSSSGTASSTWQMLAAETIGGTNKLLWRYNPTGQVHVWTLDSNWGWTGADTGLVDANSSAGWGLESSFQLDLNSDSIIGAPLTSIESLGNTSLGRHISTSQAFVSVGNTTTPITYLGSPTSPGNTSSTWQMLAAESIGGNNKLLWRYNPTGQVHVWALNSSWGWTGADTGLVDPISSTGSNLLAQFGLASV